MAGLVAGLEAPHQLRTLRNGVLQGPGEGCNERTIAPFLLLVLCAPSRFSVKNPKGGDP